MEKGKRVSYKIIFSVLILLLLAFSACKKDSLTPKEDPFEIDTSRIYLSDLYENNLRDSIWYYYKLFSLWQEVIPPTDNNQFEKIREAGFIRNNYTQYFKTGENILDYLMSLTKNRRPNRVPEKNYDWYSILDRGGSISDEIQGIINSGLGLTVFYLQSNNQQNAEPFISLVQPKSPAYEAGLRRGDQILSINGDSKLDYNYQKQNNFKSLNYYITSSHIQIKVKKPNGDILNTDLTYRDYSSSPLIAYNIIEENSKKIGYFIINSFASIIDRGTRTSFYYDLENLFSNFEASGINELVIDLRNNGGGDVESAIYLANKIVPSTSSGSKMLSYEINPLLTSMGWAESGEEFAPTNFIKGGNLQLSKVYFLVSSRTASASELLINVLKPVMGTYLIGTNIINEKNQTIAENTYGKPVGFFEIKVVDDQVGFYPASFKMYNQKGQGDYFNGLTPNAHVWEFMNFHDFGDKRESMLASALSHIHTGSYSKMAIKASTENNTHQQIFFTRKHIETNSMSKLGMFKFKK